MWLKPKKRMETLGAFVDVANQLSCFGLGRKKHACFLLVLCYFACGKLSKRGNYFSEILVSFC